MISHLSALELLSVCIINWLPKKNVDSYVGCEGRGVGLFLLQEINEFLGSKNFIAQIVIFVSVFQILSRLIIRG